MLAESNLPIDRARELFKPSADSASFLVSITKMLGNFGFGFL